MRRSFRPGTWTLNYTRDVFDVTQLGSPVMLTGRITCTLDGLLVTPGQAQQLAATRPSTVRTGSYDFQAGSFRLIASDILLTEAEGYAIANGADPLAVLLPTTVLTVRVLSARELLNGVD